MKKLLLPIAFALVLSACGGDDATSDSNSGNSGSSNVTTNFAGSPEEFAQTLTQHVIDSNYNAIAALIITQDEMVELIQGSNVTPMGKEVAVKNVPTEIGKMKNDFATGLVAIRQGGATSGIVWSNTKFKEAKYEVAAPNGYNMMQLKCVVDCNGITQTFTVTDVVETKNGWKLGGTMLFGDVQVK